MRMQIEKIFNLKEFFKIKQSSKNSITCNLEKPSQIMLQNIHQNWLQSIWAKTFQNFPVYLSMDYAERKSKSTNSVYGYINQCLPSQINEVDIVFSDNICSVVRNCNLNFSIMIPQQEIMQYFIQWQRYRKYWWSSITTTPGLFSVDMKYEDKNTYANISANFNWGQWTVETINVTPSKNISENSVLCCMVPLEKSLITLLLDATTNISKEEYLRINNEMAPYKISFALDYKDESSVLPLQKLATQIFYKLQSNQITAWLPNFTLSLKPQIQANLQMGVTYTAILSEVTLSNGIFNLMNSSTMLKEQVHLADFVGYAALLCGHSSVSTQQTPSISYVSKS